MLNSTPASLRPSLVVFELPENSLASRFVCCLGQGLSGSTTGLA
jgi:hypothetical protein